jgi:hypothetical protein
MLPDLKFWESFGALLYSAFPRFILGKVLVKKWGSIFLTRIESLIERNYMFIGIPYLIPAGIGRNKPSRNVTNTKHINCAVILVHATKAYGGCRSTVLLIVNLGIKWIWVANYTPRSLYPWLGAPVPIRQ